MVTSAPINGGGLRRALAQVVAEQGEDCCLEPLRRDHRGHFRHTGGFGEERLDFCKSRSGRLKVAIDPRVSSLGNQVCKRFAQVVGSWLGDMGYFSGSPFWSCENVSTSSGDALLRYDFGFYFGQKV